MRAMTVRAHSSFVPLVALVAAVLTGGIACSSSSAPGDATGNDAAAADATSPDREASADAEDAGTNPSGDATSSEGSFDALTTGAVDGADGAPEDAAGSTCGPPPARYTVLAGKDAGLVRDNLTGLLWMSDSVGGGEPPQTQTAAASYCNGRKMRLPTKDEAIALAANYAPCAFGQWSTWTSTAATAGEAWVVDYMGDVSSQVADNFPSAVLCVVPSSTE